MDNRGFVIHIIQIYPGEFSLMYLGHRHARHRLVAASLRPPMKARSSRCLQVCTHAWKQQESQNLQAACKIGTPDVSKGFGTSMKLKQPR